jgi:hypothetical protein
LARVVAQTVPVKIERLTAAARGNQLAVGGVAQARSLVRPLVLADALPELLTRLVYDLLEEGDA